jgi:hypothetical protein
MHQHTALVASCVISLCLICGSGRATTADADVEPHPYLVIDGREAEPAAVGMERTDARITLALRAPRDGSYCFGLALEAATVTALAAGRPEYSAEALQESLTLRYPYDWTYQGSRNVLSVRPRLVMPGVAAGGRLYLMDTHELAAVRLEPTEAGLLRALLLAHRFHNDGGDAATAELRLRAGDRVRLDILVFDGLADANRSLFGTAEPMQGRMTQTAYRGWTARSFGEEEYREAARRLADAFDYVIVREVGIHDWIPPIFHQRGIKVIAYQYLAALRRYSAQVPEEREAALAMTGSGGQLYTAPTSPGGAWLLLDIRREQMRELLVARARAAIEAGFDGIFLDGTAFFADAAGRRGGNVPEADHSLAWAQWKLLSETADAVHAAAPGAFLGVLGNHYYDSLGAADFVVKERMYFAWDDFAREFDQRRTSVGQEFDLAWEDGQAPYVLKNLAYGVKGYSPISVQSALHFIRRPTGLFYMEPGDFLPDRLDAWLDTVLAIATQDDLYITSIDPPDCRVHFEGLATVWADQDCTVEFSRPACLLAESGECQQHQVNKAQLPVHRRYQVVRDCNELG